jgi:small ligand-binding sensory domain FIST
MVFAAAMSTHPEPAVAVGEVVGDLLDQLGERPDVVVVFASGPNVAAMALIVAALNNMLQPGTLIGATAASVLGGAREAEHDAGLSVWAAVMDDVTPVRLEALPAGDGQLRIAGLDDLDFEHSHTLIMLADPFSFPTAQVVDALCRRHRHLKVVGGEASASAGSTGTVLAVDGTTVRTGAVGLLLGKLSPAVEAIVAHGAEPLGPPMTVTSHGPPGTPASTVSELAGQPAAARLRAAIDDLSPGVESADPTGALLRSVVLGVALDEDGPRFDRGHFAMAKVLHVDHLSATIDVARPVPVGTTVRFHLRSASTASSDLWKVLGAAKRHAHAALVFTSVHRGQTLFDHPHHDADTIVDALDTTAVAGMFCTSEIGPVAGHSAMLQSTVAIAVFSERDQ